MDAEGFDDESTGGVRDVLLSPYPSSVVEQHETNESVLRRMHKDRELLGNIKRRKLEYFGHMLRGPKYRLLQTIIQGRIEGKREIGRKCLSWLRNLRAWTGLKVEELYRVASDRERFKDIVDGRLRSDTSTAP